MKSQETRSDLSLPPLVLEEKKSAAWGAQNSSVFGFLLCSAFRRGPLLFKNYNKSKAGQGVICLLEKSKVQLGGG